MAILYTATRPSDTKWLAERLTSQNLEYNQGDYQYIDGSYVAHGIAGNGDGGAAINAIVEHGETTGNTMWFHFELIVNTFIGRLDGIIHEMYDTNDNLLVRFDVSNDSSFNTSVYGTGNASTPYYGVGKLNVPLPFDMSVTVDGVDTIAKVYINGQLIQEISTPNPGTLGKPAYTVIVFNDSSHPMSQMIWADEDTRGMKLAEIPLDETGTQTYSDWSGQTKNLFSNNDELYIITNSAPGNKFTSTLGTNGRITNAKFLNRYNVSGQDTGPNEIFFKSDGTKMYMLGDTNNSIFQYTLSTPWNISTSTYDSVSLSVGSQDSTPRGMYIKSDGTKMYMVGDTNDVVYQYTMSVAWDLSTATYDSVSFSVTTEETAPHGIDFKTDGTKMYIVGDASNSVHQYTLSTPWDLTTAVYDSVNFSVASQDDAPFAIRFKSDGTKMYILGTNGSPANSIHQYTLNTPWDLSTATVDIYQFKVYNSANIGSPPQPDETDPSGLYINWDTGRLYVCGWVSDSVDEYQIDNFFNGERTGYEIKTVRVSSRSWRSADASITNFRHMSRVGTTDYDGSTLHTSSDQTRTNYQTDFPVNPATGVAWEFSEVEAAEFGVKTEL